MSSPRLAQLRASSLPIIIACATMTLAVACSSDRDRSGTLPTTPVESSEPPPDSTGSDATAESVVPSGTDAPSEATTAAPESSATAASDTTYLDLYVNQGIVYDPFYPDALGGDINYAEAVCTQAVTDLASFGAARGDIDATGALASLQAVDAAIPPNFEPALRAWEQFIADHADAYSGPFLPVSQGDRSDGTLRSVLVDPAVVAMLDAYTALELRPPNDYLGFLNSRCTLADA